MKDTDLEHLPLSNMYQERQHEKKPNRAFIIAKHDWYGYLILLSYKRKKGTYGQLPGGRIDKSDSSPITAAARELFEETGIDVRNSLERLSVARFPDGTTTKKRRQYFRLQLSNNDEIVNGNFSQDRYSFRLQLSEEHKGFLFEKSVSIATQRIEKHSGGEAARAFHTLETAAGYEPV